MKKLLFLCAILLSATITRAQNGLEGIIVEKYYISNAADAAGSTGILPAGSTTYRIYVDMLPGYTFQAAYGVADHELRFQTSTAFFNNEYYGSTTPSYSKNNARFNTVMLDTWLSGGAGCAANVGVLKSEDNVAGGATVINANGILANNDPNAGIPLTTHDGLYAGTPGSVTLLGFTAAELNVLDNISNAGNLIATSNASWAVLGGVSGPAPANKVLIAQFTTNGTFSFKLNLQLGTPTPGVSQNYVAENPTGSEILFPGLIYPAPSNPSALVSIASNVSFPVCQGTSVTFTATPTNGGATPSYQWKKNGVNVGSNSPTYTSSTLANNNEIKCIMTSSIPGALNNPATSNAIIAGILSAPSVPVVTATGPTTYCSGTNLCSLSTPATTGLSYQWIKGSNPVAGATNAVYVPTSTTSSNYKVIVTNSLGCSKTSSATAITVNKNPTATVSSSGPTTFCSGANACTLMANAGTGLSYQWFKGSNPLANATGISYVPTTSSNSYKVRVTNANGCTKTSSSTAIVVNPLPAATITPQGPTTFCAGDSVILQASSGAGLSYQWLQGTAAIAGATASGYTAKLARTYKVRVTNANGCSKTSAGLKTTINCRAGELSGVEQVAQLELYPNPNDGNFMVHYSGSNENSTSITLHLVDMTGRMVHSETIETMDGTLSARVNPGSSLAAGIYFVRLLDGESEVVGKIIVE